MKLLTLLAILLVALACASCGGKNSDDLSACMQIDPAAAQECVDQVLFGYFQRDARKLQDMGLPVYWLGRQFIVSPGGPTFRGPYGMASGSNFEGGAIYMRYTAESLNPGLGITVYSATEWELLEDRVREMCSPSSEGQVTRQTVTVNGTGAELLSIPSLPSRPVNCLTLIVVLDPVVVVAVAASGGQSPGGGDYNLFINNPGLLVQVMQNLRPYPQ